MRTGRRTAAAAAAIAALIVPAAALGAFPGNGPGESVRANAPDDPAFDRCEPDNEGGATCADPFDEQTERFGFAPAGSQNTAVYRNNGCALGPATCGDPHVRRLELQNKAAGRNPAGQVSGVSADRAWKSSIGDPSVQVAILDTGILWDRESLRQRIHLNGGELPAPEHGRPAPVSDADRVPACGSFSAADDATGDGAFNVLDYVCDPRVDPAAGAHGSPSALDAEDLIAAFSDGTDADGNGYADDIAGWDFFDDDNDPYDASSYFAAEHHGSGRASDAAEEGDDGEGGIGVCPRCQIAPMRVWDTFVVDSNNFGQAVAYAADNDIEVVEGAVGGLFNSSFARQAFRYAYSHGTFLALVSSDLNTADHNFPTDYDEAFMVQGTVADSQGLGTSTGSDDLDAFLGSLGIPTAIPTRTWFRNSGTTQYGGHAHIVMPAVTGSVATGQASGAAGLLASFAVQRDRAGLLAGGPLEPNEIKQLLTMTAEDVLPQNVGGTGVPDPALRGWDQHFGYGRPDLGLAMQRIRLGQIPPQAMITSPDWFAPLNVSRQGTVGIRGRASADRSSGFTWKLQWAPGLEPKGSEFRTVHSATGTAGFTGQLGSINLRTVRAALDDRLTPCPTGALGSGLVMTGGSACDPTAPAKGIGDVDPNEPAFTVRLLVRDAEGLRGEDRKVLFAYRDPTLHAGWSRPVAGSQDGTGKAPTGGEASQRLYDLNGDNRLDVIEATSSGKLDVVGANGLPLASFNRGQPVETLPYPNVHAGAPAYSQVEPPREVLRTPAIGDVDGDREPEIVDTAGEHLYAWSADGSALPGFPVRVDPAFSEPQDRTTANHVKRGFAGSPTLADLDGDGTLDVVAGATDGHLYAWHGDGTTMDGFPVDLRVGPCTEDFPCAETINTPAIADLDGDGAPEIVIATNEFDENTSAPGAPSDPGDLVSIIRGAVVNALAEAIGGTGRIYAVHADGNEHPGGPFLSGWPIAPAGIAPNVLPFAGPGIDAAIGNVDSDPEPEAITWLTSGIVEAVNADGSVAVTYDPMPLTGETLDKPQITGLFEYPIVADLDPASPGLEVMKGGITLNQLVNLAIAVGQNLPYNHVLQAWNGSTGTELPAYPQAVEDYQLLSSPAVADASGAPGPEALVGTGLYLIRDLNATGVEGPGWPKFTGGWNFATPATGDVDGDGRLEVAAQTREGFAFLWDTDRPACGGNDQWWTFHHDEWNTGAYDTDSRPPSAPEGLVAQAGEAGSVRLSWKAAGDDWSCGSSARYQVIGSDVPIAHPDDGQVVASGGGAPAGQAVQRTLSAATIGDARYLAVLYRDEAGNWGALRATGL